MKLPDANIAATALTHGITLVTRNTRDFKNVVGIVTIDPHSVSQLPSSIMVQGDIILIPQGEDGGYYQIRTAEIDEIRGDNNSGLSEWAMQLLDKIWVNPALLYELAVLTQRIRPENQINWRDTFAVVEKKNYLEKAGEIMNIADEPDEKGSAFGEVLKMIKLGQEEQNDETNNRIAEIVSQKLIEYGLPNA